MTDVKIAPSILSADFAKMAEAVENLCVWNADYVHVDVMDGIFVPNITFGMPMVAALRKYTGMVLDVHLMITKPERYVPEFIKAGSDVISFHPDASDDVGGTLDVIRSAGLKCGLVLNPDKGLELVEPYLDKTDVITLMGVYAGFGGQKYIPETTEKIKSLKKLIAGRDVAIEIDGGVTIENAAEILNAGADVLVAGSAVFKAKDPKAAIDALRNAKTK